MPEETKEPNPASLENPAPADTKPAPSAAAAPETNPAPPAPAQPVQAAATPLTGDKPAAAAPKLDEAPKAAAPLAKPATPAAAAAKPVAAPAKPAPKPEAPKPEPWNCDLVSSLKAQYGSGIREASTYARQNCLAVDSSIAWEILLRLRDDELFDYCVDITAVHYPKREAQFDIVYVLYSFHKNERLRLKTQIKDGEHGAQRGQHLAYGQLAGARGLRHVRHYVRGAPGTQTHSDARGLDGPSAAQGLRHPAAGPANG